MDIKQAADLIWEEGRQGRYFPDALRNQLTFAEALRVQLNLLARKQAEGGQLAGWKIGLTSARVRERFGTDDQPFGHIMADRVFDSGVDISWGGIVNCGIEPELCFTMGETLRGPGVTPEQARAAVRAVSPGFEINEGRSGGKADFPLTVADDLSQWGIVCGTPLEPVPVNFDFAALRMEMRKGGEIQAEAVGAEVIDDHYLSLATLANTLGECGVALEGGQRVITGSYSKHEVRQGETWRADFAGIGAVEISFT